MQIHEEEQRDGVRFVWNMQPSSKIEQAKGQIPQAVHYTPLIPLDQPTLPEIPSRCKCGLMINCYCKVDAERGQSICWGCGRREKIRETKNGQNQQVKNKLPPELQLDYSTMEFYLNNHKKAQPNHQGYLFIIDTTVEDKQLNAIKKSLLSLIESLPDATRISLITFNQHVFLYDFGNRIPTTICLGADKPYHPALLADALGVSVGQNGHSSMVNHKFMLKIGQFREKIVKRINSLKKWSRDQYKHERPLRATGQALNIAISLNEIAPQTCRMVLFAGGVCTHGLGKIIEPHYSMQMRAISQSWPQLSKNASDFYFNLSQRMLGRKLQLDGFFFSVQEVGFKEMSALFRRYGGFIVMQEEFDSQVFRNSFQKAYGFQQKMQENQQKQGKNEMINRGIQAVIQIRCSKQIVVCGMLGQTFPFTISKDKHQSLGISSKQLGIGQTNKWYVGTIHPTRTFTFLIELADSSCKQDNFFIQFHTTFISPFNRYVQMHRVTTLSRIITSDPRMIADGFDQQAAVTLLSKLALEQKWISGKGNLRSWLDDLLVKWAINFGKFKKGDPQSFSLPETMKSFPQYIYNLRKQPIMRRYGLSLDELEYHSTIMGHEHVQHVCTMIQPALLQYSLQHPQPTPRPLDAKFMKEEVILVMDNYFHVVEWQGETIMHWIKEGYHEHPEYPHVQKLVTSPQQDVAFMLSSRFPVPQFIKTHHNHSKERYLKSRISGNSEEKPVSEHMLTDDANIATFTKFMIQLVVK